MPVNMEITMEDIHTGFWIGMLTTFVIGTISFVAFRHHLEGSHDDLISRTTVFKSGSHGFDTFRIPALMAIPPQRHDGWTSKTLSQSDIARPIHGHDYPFVRPSVSP